MKRIKDIAILLDTVVKIVSAVFFSILTSNEKKYFLVGSDYGRRRDENAEALFSYIINNGQSVFFVQNNKQCIAELKRGSLKSFTIFFSARAVFFTHSLSDILPNSHKLGFLLSFLPTPKRIFIQHGIIALKSKINQQITLSQYLKSIEKTFDVMAVSSDTERDIVIKLGIPARKLKVTGLPSFDYLVKSCEEKQVLIFLTWNKQGYREKLEEILKCGWCNHYQEAGYRLKVMVHNMMDFLPNVPQNILIGRDNLQYEINHSSILITDDSSVSWDFIYLDSDVVYYKPSLPWLLPDYHMSMLENRITFNMSELDQTMNGILFSMGFQIKRHPIAQYYFKYHDKNNSRRVFELVS